MRDILKLLSCMLLSFSVAAMEPITPLETVPGLSLEKVRLGQKLFSDKRLSRDNSVSCESCHDLSLNGADEKPLSIGINGKNAVIKTPTVYNSAYNFAQFWDGRSRTLEHQVSGPIHNPLEMGSHWGEVILKLQKDLELVRSFNALYEDGLTASNIADAIATFERSLVTLDSDFDRWLKGEENALSEEAKQGYALFKNYGCISCHQGRNVGGNMYAHMGAFGNYFSDRNIPITKADYGRFNVTGIEEDKHLFKVPSLRLVSLQKYFFHDASESNLESAVQVMAYYQLGREVNDTDAKLITKFLQSLVGRHSLLEQR
jgi:cytochrome c peroxidase